MCVCVCVLYTWIYAYVHICIPRDINRFWVGSPWRSAKVLTSGLEVSEFEFESRYYVHFRTNTLRTGIEPLPHNHELKGTTSVPPQ